jgi:hypothetical protein
MKISDPLIAIRAMPTSLSCQNANRGSFRKVLLKRPALIEIALSTASDIVFMSNPRINICIPIRPLSGLTNCGRNEKRKMIPFGLVRLATTPSRSAVGVTCSEHLFCPVDCKLLNFINIADTCVIPSSRITFNRCQRHNRSESLPASTAQVVLGGDKLDLAPLAKLLPFDSTRNYRIGN